MSDPDRPLAVVDVHLSDLWLCGFDREPRHRLCTNLDTTCARVMFVFTKSDTGRVNLLCIDELGYIELDRRGAELLFQVLTEREEKNSHYRDRAPIPTGWPAPGLSTSDQGRTRRLLG